MSLDLLPFLRVAMSWSITGSVLLLLTEWLNQRFLRGAALRHVACTLVFGGLWLVPLTQITKLPLSACCPRPVTVVGLGLGLIWVSGTVFLLSRLALALVRLRAWRRESLAFGAELVNLQQLKNRCGVRGNFEIRISVMERPETPVTWGFWRPVILLPKAAQDWTSERLEAVLLHELGHVHRRDHLTQILTFVVCSFHWFNPIFWRAARQLETDAEIAADDFAILAGIRPSVYAAELLHLARQAHSRVRIMNLAETSMVKLTTVEHRITSIVDPAAARGPIELWRLALVKALILTLFVSAGLSIRAFNPEVKAPTCLPNEVP